MSGNFLIQFQIQLGYKGLYRGHFRHSVRDIGADLEYSEWVNMITSGGFGI